MLKNSYNVIGVMSGTSLDGIDLAYISFVYNEKWEFIIHISETVKYNDFWFQKLKEVVSLPIEDLKVIDEDYTEYLSTIIIDFIKKNQLSNIEAVCSHGHTALHQPQKGITYQLGNLPKIANLLNLKVVCDFRVQDVYFKGQGAPLVPIGDKLLFSQFDFCLNLGGFANISTDINSERIAFDICPVNIVLNYYSNQVGLEYDNEGRIASTGEIHNGLLERLNELDFYQQNYPKSLGLEWVKIEIFPMISTFDLKIVDILRTFVEHISIQISKEINKKERASVLATGGGVYHTLLINRIKDLTKSEIHIPNRTIIEFKEALIFGFLGVLKLRNQINCLSSVTGAVKDHSSGKIYCP